MIQTVSAQEARNKFAEMLNTAIYGLTSVVITRFNKPQAVIINYREYERLVNPRSRFTSEEWEDGFRVFERIRKKNKDIPFQKILKGIEKAIRQVRRGRV